MRKSLRQFECRDDIWTRVETLAQRRGITPDEVVQAALVKLFTKKTATTEDSSVTGPPKAAAPAASQPPPAPPRAAPIPAPVPASGSGSLPPRPPPPRPGPPTGGGRLPPPSPSRAPSRPPPPTAPQAAAATPSARPLYLWVHDEWHVIDQDQFVIGRGAKYSDLAIKDANISRRHCAVVRRNGDYFIKDLGSTNGIEFDGVRVDNHKVVEGAIYQLCEHELRFTFDDPF